MPQRFADVLEPKMQKVARRIPEINRLKDLGWEVHVNYSPLVFYKKWKEDYSELFKMVKDAAGVNKCEVIALTNHANQMARSSDAARELMSLSYEVKNSSGVMRYPLKHKTRLLEEFKELYSQYFDLDTIRYIF